MSVLVVWKISAFCCKDKKPSLLFQHYSRIPGSTYYSQNYAGIICLSLALVASVTLLLLLSVL